VGGPLQAAYTQPKIVQELPGDSQISVVLDTYSHVSMDLKRKASEKMNETLIRREKKATGEGEEK